MRFLIARWIVGARNLFALTPRERQIYEALLRGATTREVAEAHGLGRQTVKNYVTVIYEKLGIESRSQLRQSGAPNATPVVAGRGFTV